MASSAAGRRKELECFSILLISVKKRERMRARMTGRDGERERQREFNDG